MPLILRGQQMDSREVPRGQGVVNIVLKNSTLPLRLFSVPSLSNSYQILRRSAAKMERTFPN